MDRIRRHWSAYAWIACLAILFNAFAPMLSWAAPASPATPLEMEVCTAMGMEMMPVSMAPADAGKGDAGKPAKSMAHCECCMTHATALGLPPPLPTPVLLAVTRDAYPRLYYLAPRPLFPWALAQPRAPPHLA